MTMKLPIVAVFLLGSSFYEGGAFQLTGLPEHGVRPPRGRREATTMRAAVANRRSEPGRQGFMKNLVQKDCKKYGVYGDSTSMTSLLSFQHPSPLAVAPIGVENYRHVMAVCEDEARWERILELFRAMLAAHVEPDQDIHDRVARAALAIKTSPPDAQPLVIPPYPQPFRTVRSTLTTTAAPPESSSPSSRPSSSSKRPARAVKEKEAVNKKVVKKLARPPAAAAVTLTTESADAKEEQSPRLSEALREVVLRPSELTYSAAIFACVEEGGEQWETALKMYEDALYRGIDLPQETKSAVLEACEQGNQLKYAETVFHQMSRPEVSDYCQMMALYRTFHRWRDAENTYSKMASHIAQEPLYSGSVSQLFDETEHRPDQQQPSQDGEYGNNDGPQQQPLEVTLAIMQYMVDCPRSGVAPDKLTFLAAMEVAAKERRWDMCIFLYVKSREMLDDGALELSWALVQALEAMGKAKMADHVYEMAYRKGVVNHWSKWLDRVDLHHFSQLTARVAVRQVFNEFLEGPGGALPLHLDRPEKGLIIVTGSGKRSENGTPVLRPAILKMLKEEFNPSLRGAHVCKDNKGRIIVPWQNIEKWIEGQHNLVQKLRRNRRKPAGKLRALITC